MIVDEERPEYQQFRENIERFLQNQQDREASIFLYNLFNLWITFFFRDYQKTWGDVFDSEEKKDLRQEIIRIFFNVLKQNKISNYREAKAYLLRTFQTKCIDFIRKKERHFLRIEEDTNSEVLIISSEDTSAFSLSDKFQVVEAYWQKALAQSNETTRTIINSLYWGVPYEEICKQLGLREYSANQFKVKVSRAKKSFQKTLLDILEKALSQEKLNSVEHEIIEHLCKNIKKNL